VGKTCLTSSISPSVIRLASSLKTARVTFGSVGLEQAVTLLGVEGENLLLKISFLLKYHDRMIAIEEKDRIVIPFSDFKVEDWGDGVRKVADIE